MPRVQELLELHQTQPLVAYSVARLPWERETAAMPAPTSTLAHAVCGLMLAQVVCGVTLAHSSLQLTTGIPYLATHARWDRRVSGFQQLEACRQTCSAPCIARSKTHGNVQKTKRTLATRRPARHRQHPAHKHTARPGAPGNISQNIARNLQALMHRHLGEHARTAQSASIVCAHASQLLQAAYGSQAGCADGTGVF